MDIDPLSAESAPPRYAIESDDEEDEIPLSTSSTSTSPPSPTHTIKITAPSLPASPSQPQQRLLIASGDAGAFFAAGAALGEQIGAVYVDGVQIGLLFSPAWMQTPSSTQAPTTVLISEPHAKAKLPLSAMHPYASAALARLLPESLAVLDTYPTPTYATDEPIAFHDAPIRYLTTDETLSFSNTHTHTHTRPAQFAPPNLISGTSAAFLTSPLPSPSPSPSSQSTQTPKRTLILLPSPHIPPAPPRILSSSSSSSSSSSQPAHEWSAQTMNDAQALLLLSLGQTELITKGEDGQGHKWTPPRSGAGAQMLRRSGRSEVGEGGMYI